VPCGTFYSPGTAYPGGVAFSQDGKSAYAILNQNNTLAKIDLTTMTQGPQIRVGNAPHSIVINTITNGGQIVSETAYVSNEGGRPATQGDFQIWSAGTPIVADPVNGSGVTGTVSVVNLKTMKVVNNIPVGLHPTGMALCEEGQWRPQPDGVRQKRHAERARAREPLPAARQFL
jgi:YVTN family beta-propeller protein